MAKTVALIAVAILIVAIMVFFTSIKLSQRIATRDAREMYEAIEDYGPVISEETLVALEKMEVRQIEKGTKIQGEEKVARENLLAMWALTKEPRIIRWVGYFDSLPLDGEKPMTIFLASPTYPWPLDGKRPIVFCKAVGELTFKKLGKLEGERKILLLNQLLALTPQKLEENIKNFLAEKESS